MPEPNWPLIIVIVVWVLALITVPVTLWIDPGAVSALVGLTISAVILTLGYVLASWGANRP